MRPSGRTAASSRLLNPAPVVRWNAHKRYLVELDRAGLPGDRRERRQIVANVQVIGVGKRERVPLRGQAVNADEAVGILKRQGPKHHRIDDAEDGRRSAEPHRQREDRDQRDQAGSGAFDAGAISIGGAICVSERTSRSTSAASR